MLNTRLQAWKQTVDKGYTPVCKCFPTGHWVSPVLSWYAQQMEAQPPSLGTGPPRWCHWHWAGWCECHSPKPGQSRYRLYRQTIWKFLNYLNHSWYIVFGCLYPIFVFNWVMCCKLRYCENFIIYCISSQGNFKYIYKKISLYILWNFVFGNS